MGRPPLASFRIAWQTLRSLLEVFRRERLGLGFLLVAAVFLLALIFAYLTYTPVLSPFLYPIF